MTTINDIKNDPKVSTLLNLIKNQRLNIPIFRCLGDLYSISAKLDIFFCALEKRLNELPTEKERFSKYIDQSIYMAPECIKNELEYILPFVEINEYDKKINELKKENNNDNFIYSGIIDDKKNYLKLFCNIRNNEK